MNFTLNEPEKQGFHGLTVAAFESRMAKEMEELILRHGGKPRVAPSMREIPLEENKEAFDFFEKLRQGRFQLVVLMTGVGTRTLFQTLGSRFAKDEIIRTFQKVSLAARGPKSVKALAEYGLQASFLAAEPNTWKEVLAALDVRLPLKGLNVAVQEYGISNPEFLKGLKERGAREVWSVPVYRWALPEDVQPLVRLIESILNGEAQAALFTSATQIHNVFHVAKGLGKEKQLKESFAKMLVASIGSVTSEALREQGLVPDLEPEHPKMGFLVKEAAEKSRDILGKKSAVTVHFPAPQTPETGNALRDSLFLKACRKEPTSRPPLWIMRQAGRYLPEYRKIRSKVSFLELCKTPDLAAEVTVTAQQVLGVDAAILFADILLLAEPLGFKLEFTEDKGPVIHNPLRGRADLERLKEVDAPRHLAYVMEAVRKIRAALEPDVPLIGFAGAPFTLASYLIEGGSSPNHAKTRSLLSQEPEVWDSLMRKLVQATQGYLTAQAQAGAQALQLFDSWVGRLTVEEFKTRVLPHLKELIAGLPPGVPVIYFGTETAPFFPWLKETGATVIGVDWRVPLEEAWKQLGDVAVQGNLDPNILLETPDKVREKTAEILRRAGGRPGHIFNLGHGILPQTPLENVRAMIETVKTTKKPSR